MGVMFDEATRAYLLTLPAVEAVGSTGRISYAPAFRRQAARRLRAGVRPAVVFRAAGLGPEVIGRKRIERCAARWRSLPVIPPAAGPTCATVGERARLRLSRLHRSTAWLAGHLRLGVDETGARIEGRVPWSADEIARLSALLHVSADWLLGLTDTPQPQPAWRPAARTGTDERRRP